MQIAEYRYQGGDQPSKTPFMDIITDFLKGHFPGRFSLLNLGSGISFYFEQAISGIFCGNIDITCIDITPPPAQFRPALNASYGSQ